MADEISNFIADTLSCKKAPKHCLHLLYIQMGGAQVMSTEQICCHCGQRMSVFVGIPEPPVVFHGPYHPK